jgi:hypothetical protein
MYCVLFAEQQSSSSTVDHGVRSVAARQLLPGLAPFEDAFVCGARPVGPAAPASPGACMRDNPPPPWLAMGFSLHSGSCGCACVPLLVRGYVGMGGGAAFVADLHMDVYSVFKWMCDGSKGDGEAVSEMGAGESE